MGRYAREPQGGTGDFEQTPEGTHLGICFRIIDLGTRRKDFDGEERVVNEVLISWELPDALMSDGRPFAISGFYTNSLHEKAKLRAHLASWRGKQFTQAELERFDLVNILNKAALVSVGRTPGGKEKVNAVLAVPKGTPTPSRTNELLAFFIDEWDDAVWEQIPKGIQNLIKESDEYRNRGELPDPEQLDREPNPDDDTPPF